MLYGKWRSRVQDLLCVILDVTLCEFVDFVGVLKNWEVGWCYVKMLNRYVLPCKGFILKHLVSLQRMYCGFKDWVVIVKK